MAQPNPNSGWAGLSHRIEPILPPLNKSHLIYWGNKEEKLRENLLDLVMWATAGKILCVSKKHMVYEQNITDRRTSAKMLGGINNIFCS